MIVVQACIYTSSTVSFTGVSFMCARIDDREHLYFETKNVFVLLGECPLFRTATVNKP